MPVLNPQSIHCPVCGDGLNVNVATNVLVHRYPQLKDAIMTGVLQSAVCPGCGAVARLQPEFTYMDLDANLWILARRFADIARWDRFERQASKIFATGYGADLAIGAESADAVVATLEARVTFGWAALREKLLCADAGIDDVSLELLKASIMAKRDELPLSDGSELRLLVVGIHHLDLGWIDPGTEQLIETFPVTRARLDDICGAVDDWAGFREDMAAGPFVDVQRVTMTTRAVKQGAA